MRRFIWSADSSERFVSVSRPLAEVVGEAGADIVGRRWAEIEGRLVLDGGGHVARAFAGRTTWSNQTVLWRIAGTGHVVPVDLGGMPVYGKSHEFEGFRGFGLCRTDEIAPDPGRSARETGASLASVDEAAAPGDRNRNVMRNEAGEASRAGESGAFGALQVRVGAQLGGARPTALRTVENGSAARDLPLQPIRETGEADERRPILSVTERGALREIARALGARLEADDAKDGDDAGEGRVSAEIVPLPQPRRSDPDPVRVLDRLPAGIIVLRGETPLFLNRFMLDLIGFSDVAEFVGQGGVARLFAGRPNPPARPADPSTPLFLVTRSGTRLAVEARLTTVDWGELPASLMLVRPVGQGGDGADTRALRLEIASRDARLGVLDATLDLAAIGIASIDESGRILSLSRAAEALFGFVQNEVAGDLLTVLLAAESHPAAIALLTELRDGGTGIVFGEREVLARRRNGDTLPLLMRAGRIEAGGGATFSAVFTDISSFKRTETELNAARRAAEGASLKQSEFLARVSHEIRTPLNAIIGFAEIMLEERFGEVGSDRYKAYLRDIHESGNHVVSLVNDLLDIAKVGSGKSELSYVSLDLNEVVAGSVGILQPSASRDRIVVRTSFGAGLPRIVADERSIRQVALNVVSNAIRFTEPGGQVIVSTSLTDRGDLALRVRDTGIGMSADEIGAAMEPFRQVSVSSRGGGTGLGLPLSKALVEANHGLFSISSRRGEGTLIEILFPPSRVLAE